MTWDRDKLERANFDMGVLGTGLAVVSLALALNRKPVGNRNTTFEKREPVVFKKVRGQPRWVASGENSSPRYWFYANQTADGNLSVEWMIGVGQKESRGTFTARDLKEAATAADSVLDSYVPLFNVPEIGLYKRDFENIYYDQDSNPVCVNCGGDNLRRFGMGVFACPDCGCKFDAWQEKILWDEWDRKKFAEYREKTEAKRERSFRNGNYPTWTGSSTMGYMSPETFDSINYSMLQNREDPKDRSRILSFNRPRRRR